MPYDKIDQLYDALKKDGAVSKSREYFRSKMLAPGKEGYQNRLQLYNALKADGAIESPTYEEFGKRLGLHAVNTAPVSKPQPQKPNTDSRVVFINTPQKPAQATPAKPKPTPRKAPAKQKGTPLTKVDKQKMLAFVNNMRNETNASLQRFNNRMDYHRANAGLRVPHVTLGKKNSGIKLGQNSKVVAKKPQFNPQSGKMEQTYITESGNEYTDRNSADLEQNTIDAYKDSMSVSGQLREAYAERDRLDEAMKKRMKEIDERPNQRFNDFMREFAASMTPGAGPVGEQNARMSKYDNDDEYMQLMAAARKNHQTIQLLEDKKNNQMNSFWHSLATTASNGYTFSDGMSEMRDATALQRASKHIDTINKKREEGKTLTKEEQTAEAVLKNFAKDNAMQSMYGGDYGAWARAGGMTANSLDFMKDLMLNPGAGSIAKGVMRGTAKGMAKGIAKLTGKEAANLWKNDVLRRTLKATGVLLGAHTAGAYVSNTTGIGRTSATMGTLASGEVGVDDKGNYKVENAMGLLPAFAEAERQQARENGSEMFGEFIPGVGGVVKKGLEKIGLSKLSGAMTNIGNKEWYKQYSRLLESGGYNGLPGEALEEYEGSLFDALTGHAGDAWDDMTNLQNHVDIWLGCATMGALLGSVPMMMQGHHTAQYYRYKHNTDKADNLASFRMTAERWEPLRDEIDNTDNSKMADVVTGIINNPDLHVEEKKAALNYVRNLTMMRGYNIAQVNNASDEEEERPEVQSVNDSYSKGYETTEPQDMNDTKTLLELKREQVAKEHGIENVDDVDALIGDDPLRYIEEQKQLGNTDKLQSVIDYANAKSAYDGMVQRVQDDIDSRIEESNATVKSRVNRHDGMIHPASLKLKNEDGTDKKVYIVSGNVVMFNDGKGVDKKKSDNTIVIRDVETGEMEVIPPDLIRGLDAAIDPEEEKARAREAIIEEMSQTAANKVDGVVSFKEGDTYTLTDKDGEQTQVTLVVNEQGLVDNGDGTVNVTVDGQNVVPMSMEEIQSGVDATNMARTMQAEQEHQNNDESVPNLDESVQNDGESVEEKPDGVEYGVNDTFTLLNGEDEIIHGEVQGVSDDGVEIRTDEPLNGKYVQVIPAEEFENNVESINDADGNQVWAREYAEDTEDTNETEETLDNSAPQDNDVVAPASPTTEELVQMARGGNELAQHQLEAQGVEWEEPSEHQPTALERVPINEATQEPMFEKADRETALDALNELTGGNEENTSAIINAQVEQATKSLEALKKKAPKKKTPALKGSPMEMLKAQKEADDSYNTAIEEYNAQVATAEENLNAWTSIYSLMGDRKRAAREQLNAERNAMDEQLHAEAVAKLEEDKRIAAEKAAEQAEVGTHAVNPKIKEKWDGATKVEGNPNAITLADGSTIRGHYVLTEAGSSTASHDVNNAYEPTEGFPVDENGESVNDRDYKRDTDAQRIVRDMADSYDSRALQTPVIVSKDGVVLSGNNRTMSGEIAAKNGTDKAYVEHLREFGTMFGFTPEQIDGMQHPRVVFVPDEELPYDANTFARFNAEQQKKQSKPEHAVKLGKIVPDNVFASIVGDISRFDRMSDYYADGNAVSSAIGQLLEAGVINEMQLPELRTGNALSAAGKELIENTLIGKVFQASPDAVRQIISTPTLRQSVVMGLNEISNNRTLAKSDYDLSKELAAAVNLVNRAKSESPEIYKEGMPVSPYGRQQGLFDDEYGDSRVTDGVTLILADILNSGKPSDLRKFLSIYNNEPASPASGQLDMFSGGVTSKEELLNRLNEYFRNATPKEQQAIVDAAVAERKQRAEAAAQDADGSQRDGEEPTDIQGESNGGVSEAHVGLNDDEANELLSRMEDNTLEIPQIELNPTNWIEQFGENGMVSTPLGKVKMGENQIAKLFEKGRSEQFGMIKPTLEHPHVIVEVPSESSDGNTERASSLLFIKTFNGTNGKKVYYFKSVTVKKDGLEVSVSSHDDRAKRVKEALKKGKLLYRFDGGAQTERHPADVSVTTSPKITQGNDNMVRPEPTMGSNANTDTAEVANSPTEVAKGETVDRGGNSSQPISSLGKVINKQLSLQENGEKSSENEGEAPLSAKIEAASAEVNTEPTEAQKEAGNYKKGHVQVGTFDITIEQPQGSVRKGTDANGKQWESKMNNTYGYIRGAVGVDGDHIDVFLSNDIDGWNGRKVFVVDQYNPDGSFDEHKVMLGFNDADEAKGDYLANYENGWEDGRKIVVSAVNLEDFEKWIASSKRKTKAFGDYSSVKNGVVPSGEGESVERNEVLEYEKALDHLEYVEQKWVDKIQDYVSEHYPTQATTSAESTSEKGLQERKAMKADPVLKQMYAEAKKEIDAADEMVTQKYSALPEDLRQQKAVGKSAQPPTREETILRDVVIEHMKGSGLDVIGTEDGQRVLDMANEADVRFGAKQKRALETATIAEQSTNNATVVSSADGAKVQKILETLADNYEKRSNKTRGFITDLSRSLGLVQHEASQYGTFETRNGKLVTIRVSNHNARVSFFDENGEEDGISIVISSHKNKGVLNDGKAHLVEYFYPKQSLERSGGKPLADIVKCVSTVLESGKFEDTTGLAQRQEVNAQQIREHRVYHGSGAEFDAFDHSHMGEGEGSQSFGWGTYVTNSETIGKSYANRAKADFGLKRNELESDISRAKEQLPFVRGEVKEELEAKIRDWETKLENFDNGTSLYTVEIPEDNGKNYLDWRNSLPDGFNKEAVKERIMQENRTDDEFENEMLERDLSDSIDYATTGMEMYKAISLYIGDKAASKMLYDMGFVGIKYPAGSIHGGVKEGDTNYVIFNEKDAQITDHVRFFRTANGEAYGFTIGGKIYIDPKVATSETPVHEYAHLWATALKACNPKEWQNVVSLMKGTSVWDEVKSLYSELKSDDEIADEVLATYSGRRGAERLREEQRKIAKGNGGVFEKAEAISALDRVKRALKMFWKGVADFLHIHYTSAEDVADRVMKDLLDGVDPRSMMNGGNSLRPDTEINVVEGTKEHGFKNYAEAKDWAKEQIARTYSSEETGGKGDIRISNAAINKYLSQSAVDKSDSKDVHLSVLKVLPDVIRESVDAEQHADYKKGEDGVRSAKNGINPNVTIHRLYGAVRIDGKVYRVKVTLKENTRTKETPKAYSYEATKIELLEGSFSQTEGSHNLEPSNSKSEVSAGQHGNVSGLTSTFPRYSDKSITAAKLLNGVEKSYGGGKFFEDYNRIREQFIGEQGAERADHAEEVSTRLDNLSVAREMEADKKDAKAIKMATGWERGADGKWRYEIADMKEFDRNGNLLYRKHHPDYARYIELQDKDLNNLFEDGEELTGKEREEYEVLSKKYESDKFGGEKLDNNHTLEAYVDAPELFKAYPELKDVGFRFENTGGNEIASYRIISNVFDVDKDDVGEIVVNTGKVSKNTRTREVKSAVLHEMQHAIQEIEGFARGGSPKSMQRRFEAAKKEWRARAWADALRDKADEMGEHYNQVAVEKALIDEYKEMGMDNEEWMPDKETRMKGFNYFARGYADRSMDADIKNFRLNESTRADFSPYVEYTRLGGEVESRNVEHRMNMTPEERRASLAAETEDVSREDQIFLFGNNEGGSYSLKDGSAHLGRGKNVGEASDAEGYTAFANQYGVDAEVVKDYASGMKTGNLQKAEMALAEIRRTMRVANRGMKLSEFGKLFRPVQKELTERYGDIEKLRQEYIDAVMRERGVMEAARKRAEEEEAKRKAHLEEMSLLTTEELDKRYFDAIENGDDATAREMLDEAARRKGYDDTESDYQGVGAWSAPENPGYESDKARRDDLENSGSTVNLEDIALGYTPQPDDYFYHPEYYSMNTPHGLESVKVINAAIDAIKNGEEGVKVKVYRAVPTSVKEGRLRNGDWVTPSKKYAEMHGNGRLEGKYRIIEDEVPASELWWDGNDGNEWGFDDGRGYKYKNVEHNRKLNDLVTRDDNGEIIPPSKRFDENVEDVRYRESEPMTLKGEEALAALENDSNAMVDRVTELSERLHTPVRIIRTEEEVAALPSARQRRMKGSFNPLTGEVTIVVPNNANMADIENTFVHEVVGHDGLRVLFPDEAKLNNALDELYRVSNEGIQQTIDRMAQKMYDAEVDRLREKKRKEHEARGEDANASYYADMAEAHAEASKKREQFKRDATEEYGADLAGRIGEKGFEQMSAEELTFWGKLKAMLQKALQKLLDGLKIPGRRKWGDKDWAFVLHEAYKRKKNGGKPTVFDAADTEVMRRKTGFGDTKFSDGYKKSAKHGEARLNAFQLPSDAGHNVQPSEAALKHLKPTETEHDAKVQQNRENAKEALANVAETYKNTTIADMKQRVTELFEKAKTGEFVGKPASIGRLSADGKVYLEQLSGLHFKEYVDFVLNPSDLNHIRADHYGQNEKDKGNNIPLTDEDIQNMVDVLNQPDGILYGIDKNDGRKLFFFLRDAGNGLYNLTEVCSTKKGNLTAKSFFKSKKKGIDQRVMEIRQSLLPTSVTYSGESLSLDAKIPPLFDINEVSDENVADEGIMFSDGKNKTGEPKPIGHSTFGSVYNQFKGKVLQAVKFLLNHESGDLLGVFHRNDVGDIDMVWGDEGGGLCHILNKHINDKDFPTVKDLVSRIEDIINKGEVDERHSNANKLVLVKDGYLVTIRRNVREKGIKIADKNWVLTAYNKDAPATTKAPVDGTYGSTAVAPGTSSDAKLATKSEINEFSDNNVTDDGIMFRDGDSVEYNKAMARDIYEQRVSRGMYQTQEALQDSMLGLKEAMDAILKAEDEDVYIEDVAGYENAYLGENRLSSVNQAECSAFAQTLFKPLLEEVAKLAKTADERAELTDYMMAKHGLERNQVMARRAAEKDARSEFSAELLAAQQAVDNDPLDQDAIDALDDVTQRMQDREDELYLKNRERDFAGLTALTGMNNVLDAEAEAQQMVSDYESNHWVPVLWNNVKAVTNATLQKTYESGLINKATYDDISGMYENYIPLRGFDDQTSDEVYAYLADKHSAFNAPIKTAKGRKSKADDPFANMEAMAESAIMQGNRNVLVKQKFLNFALNHPSDLVSVSNLWLYHDDVLDEWQPINTGGFVGTEALEDDDSPAEVERKMREFEEAMENAAKVDPDHFKKQKDHPEIPYRVVESRDLKQHQVLVKRNGKDYLITINGNPRAAQALNGQTNPDNDVSGAIGAIMHLDETINRQLSAFYTTRNPDFVVSNFIRDMIYANTMVWVKESPNYALRFHKNFAKVNPAKMKILLAKMRNGTLDMNDETEKMFHLFMMNGGETGYANIRDIEQRKNDIKRELKKNNGQIPIRKAWALLGERLDEYNRAVENCARFAAFMTSRQLGRTIDRSVYDAKDISVNFNKKGSGAKFMGANGQTKIGNVAAFTSGLGRSFYVFWNAAIQGTTNFGRQFKRHPQKAIAGVASMFLLGALMAIIGSCDGGDDDDDKNAYYNLPEYVRRSNIVFRLPGMDQSWISMPLPVEYRAMYGMGELMISAMIGNEHYTAGELAHQMASQVSQMSPIDFMEGGGSFKAFVPSAVKPVAEVIVNKSWTGMPIYKDTPFNKDMPEWTKAYKSANKYLVGLSKVLNEATGGDAYTSGMIDINPAQVEYLLNGIFGGVSSTIDKLTKMGETIIGSREYDPRSFLLLNRLVKNGDERTEYRAVNNEYFRIKEQSEKLRTRLNHYENDTADGVFDYAEKIAWLNNSPEYRILETYEDYSGDIDDINEELKAATSDEERKELEAELNEKKKELVNAVNEIRNSKR